jgi:hypothetical protein
MHPIHIVFLDKISFFCMDGFWLRRYTYEQIPYLSIIGGRFMQSIKQIRKSFLIAALIGSLVLPASTAMVQTASASSTSVPTSAFYTQNVFESGGAYRENLYIIQGVAKDLDVQIAWSSDKKTVTLSKGKTVIKLIVGQQTAYLNGKTFKLEGKVQALDGAVMVPRGLIAKKLGLSFRNSLNYSTYLRLKRLADEQAALKAQEVTRFGFKISSEKTGENSVDLWGAVKTNAPVLIKIEKDGAQPRYKVGVAEKGALHEILFLSEGPGSYSISLYDQKTKEPLTADTQNLFKVAKSARKTDVSDYTYLLPTRYVESNNPEIKALAKQITAGLQNDMDKTKAIHDWVSTNIAYDTKELFSGDIHSYTSVQILHRKKAVCDGYSKLTAALNRAAGIKTKVIWGMANFGYSDPVGYLYATDYNHGWVETWIDGRWVVQDTTWDAGYVAGEEFTFKLNHEYFDPAPDEFTLDHLAAFVMD